MDTICIVAFRTDTDRAVRYKKVPVRKRRKGELSLDLADAWGKVYAAVRDAYEEDRADFVSIRFIRGGK